MGIQLPKWVVAAILALAFVAVGAVYWYLFFRSEPAWVPPEQQRMDEIIARTGGDVKKMTPEEREFLRRTKVAGAAVKP